jgi:hypothetical protein
MKAAKPTDQRPKATETLVSLIETTVQFRFQDQKPTLSDVARIASSASKLLRLELAERIEVENAATVAAAKSRGLMS